MDRLEEAFWERLRGSPQQSIFMYFRRDVLLAFSHPIINEGRPKSRDVVRRKTSSQRFPFEMLVRIDDHRSGALDVLLPIPQEHDRWRQLLVRRRGQLNLRDALEHVRRREFVGTLLLVVGALRLLVVVGQLVISGFCRVEPGTPIGTPSF
jgi:hypothetical protein